ncbi:HAMP domain-containing protein [bacterium D16-51]|nr:HAMP domain-containing protein [bacterium D16-59]RKI58403.1 HAMP domain-containing protein [bacterium D16-51]
MNQKNRKIKKIGRKVSLLVGCILGASIIITVLLCVTMSYRLTMSIMQNECINGTDILSYELENYSGPEDKTELLDKLKELTECEFTIFHGNERAYTTIQQDGKRAVGTKLSEDIAKKVLEQGESYIGQTKILGTDHLCSYVPTKDADGQVTGLIFSGISLQNALLQTNKTIIISCIAGGILILTGLLFISAFIRHAVTRPLNKLTSLAQTLEQGELGLQGSRNISTNIHSNNEIGLLAEIFENTTRRLKNYIGEISTILSAISNGDLTKETTQDYVGDFTSIKISLDNILQKLNHTMSQIRESSRYVAASADQMSAGAQTLSQGATQQAASVDELDGTIREISCQIAQTAENVGKANIKVTDVGKQISDSNEQMQEMINAMEEINARSNEISKIIRTIDDIAFQTNILALNATVEAARAGAEGKGFAVVAEEVRTLAGKSSEASQSSADLIEHSITAVKEGTKIANETAQQLAFATSSVNEIVDNINGIADASHTQAESISQIQVQISQISQVVQTTSATAEESAATSQQLNSQAGMLQNLINMFHLSRH